MLPPLAPPSVIPLPDGSRDLIWVLPGADLALFFEQLLHQEVGVSAIVGQVEDDWIMVKANYPFGRANQAVFAIFLFRQHYQRIQQLQRCLRLSHAEQHAAF